jgi:hypothetical protein
MPRLFAIIIAMLSWLTPSLAAEPARITIVHETPSEAIHRVALARLQASGVLEQTRRVVEAFKLPQPVTIRTRSCGGRGGAWYYENTVTVCYEYLHNAITAATARDRPAWVAEEPAVRGKFLDVFLHEFGHAVFEQLRTPFFGKEEDAADTFASFLVLNLFRSEAVGLVNGILYSYLLDANARDFGDVPTARPRWPAHRSYGNPHSVPLQRLYNLVCLASGFDEKAFEEVVARADLPGWRASGCEDEYKQNAHAFRTLIGPHVDAERLARAFPGASLLGTQ